MPFVTNLLEGIPFSLNILCLYPTHHTVCNQRYFRWKLKNVVFAVASMLLFTALEKSFPQDGLGKSTTLL